MHIDPTTCLGAPIALDPAVEARLAAAAASDELEVIHLRINNSRSLR